MTAVRYDVLLHVLLIILGQELVYFPGKVNWL